MLLVSMLGIVGCSNPSNSDYPIVENVYRVKNGTDSEMTISYENKSGAYVNEKKIPANGTYKILASDAKSDIKTFYDILLNPTDSPVIYLKITVGDTTEEGYIEAVLEKVVRINSVMKTESGWFNIVEKESIEN